MLLEKAVLRKDIDRKNVFLLIVMFSILIKLDRRINECHFILLQ